MPDKLWSLITGFLFSSSGMAMCAAIGTAILLILTRLTSALSPYAPLSYGLVALVSVILFAVLFLVIVILNNRITTKKQTSIDIFVSDGTLGVSETSNIEDQRSFLIGNSVAYLFTFRRPVRPGHVIHIDGMRGSIPKVEKQYVNRTAAYILLSNVALDCGFRLIFNKDLEAKN